MRKRRSACFFQKQVPEGAETGDELEVFIYRDSSDRPIATVKRADSAAR